MRVMIGLSCRSEKGTVLLWYPENEGVRESRLDDITLIRSGDFIYAASGRRFQARPVREEADGKPPITQILHLCQGARFLITLQFDPLERDDAALEKSRMA